MTARIREQMETLQHSTTIYLHPNMPRLAEKLASKLPPDAMAVAWLAKAEIAVRGVAATEAREALTRARRALDGAGELLVAAQDAEDALLVEGLERNPILPALARLPSLDSPVKSAVILDQPSSEPGRLFVLRIWPKEPPQWVLLNGWVASPDQARSLIGLPPRPPTAG